MQFTILAVAAFAAAAIASPVLDERTNGKDKSTKTSTHSSTDTSTQSSTKTSTQSSTKTSSSAQATQTQTNGQQLQQQCGNNQKLSCCNSVQQQFFNGVPIQVGITCVLIDILSVVPVNQQCSTQAACCQSGSQVGLVNVGNVCPILF